jgi:low affinity Fe/Cu permease
MFRIVKIALRGENDGCNWGIADATASPRTGRWSYGQGRRGRVTNQGKIISENKREALFLDTLDDIYSAEICSVAVRALLGGTRPSRVALDCVSRRNHVRAQLPVGGLGSSSHPSSWFEAFASRTARFTGRPVAFLLAFLTVLVWSLTGPIFHYSDTWQLVINTGTTIVTFLMVFLIQNTQNRDTIALQLKLDELILVTRGAHDHLAGIEDGSEQEMEAAREQVHARAGHSRPEPAK